MGQNHYSRKTKTSAQIIHAKRRLLERYGIEIDDEGYEQIINMCKAGDTSHIYSMSNYRSIKILTWNWVKLKCVYDNKRGTIVTFLPITEKKKKFNHIPRENYKFSTYPLDHKGRTK